jgi:peptidyl-tRNA hydrolase
MQQAVIRKRHINDQTKNLTKLNRKDNPMKLMIPFLMAMLPVASLAQSQSGTASGVPSVAIPKTTAVLVIQTVKQGVTAQQVMAVMPAEIRATVKLYLDGKIREWYSRGDGKGVVVLVEAQTEDEARAILETLPLAKEQLMDTEYVPVGPLMPLRMLIGPGAQQ